MGSGNGKSVLIMVAARIRSGVFFRDGRASRVQRDCLGSLLGAGHPAGCADVPRGGQDACRVVRVPTKLRQNVTSPNGTTHAALQTFAAEGFQEIVDKAVKAATNRAAELGNTLANNQTTMANR